MPQYHPSSFKKKERERERGGRRGREGTKWSEPKMMCEEGVSTEITAENHTVTNQSRQSTELEDEPWIGLVEKREDT